MVPSSIEVDETLQQDNWGPQDDQQMGPGGTAEPANGAPMHIDDDRAVGQGSDNPDFPRGSSVGDVSVSDSKVDTFREKQVKPNKVYVGGLPEHTQQDDLQSCFGKIGNIINIELKVGYGFVEFDTREAAEESVAKYHEGFFMGNKIRVELSHGGGRTAKYSGDPGACFKCGQMGHWARECPNHTGVSRRPHDPPLIDRIQRDSYPPPRNMPPRDELGPSGRFQPRDARYDYPHGPPPPREYRRAPSPRDFREYPPPPPPSGRGREYYDDRRGQPSTTDRDRYPPQPPVDFRGRYPPPDPSYRYNGPAPAPPSSGYYDRYDRRANERYMQPYPPAHGGRPRTPPRPREEFDRPPTRDYDYRGRPPTPPRYVGEYSPRGGVAELPPPGRYRRRSESPPPRTYDQAYPSGAGYSNGYPGNITSGPPTSGPPSRGGPPSREYPTLRNGREPIESGPGYRRH